MATSLRDQIYYYQQSSFAGGELSPDMYGRNDFTKYAIGLSNSTNMYSLPFGGVVSRAGTEFLLDLSDDPSSSVQMIPFSFSNSQNILLLFIANDKEKLIYFLADGGMVVKDGKPYTIEHTFDRSCVGNLQYVQSADVLFIAHNSHEPMKLARYDTYDWRFESFNTTNGSPYGAMNDTDITLSYHPKVDTITFPAYNLNNVFRPTRYNEVNYYSELFGMYKGTLSLTATGTVHERAQFDTLSLGSSYVEIQKQDATGKWVVVASTGELTAYRKYDEEVDPIVRTISYTDKAESGKAGYYRIHVYSRAYVTFRVNISGSDYVDYGNPVTVTATSPQTTQTGNPYPSLTASQSLFKQTDLLTWIKIDEAVKAHESNFRPSDGQLSYTGTALPINGQWSILMSGKLQGSFGVEISNDGKRTWETYKLWNVKDVDTFQNSGEVDGLAYIRLVVKASEVAGVVQLNVDSFVNSSYAQIVNVVDDKTVNVSFETHVQSRQYGIIDEFKNQYNYYFSSWTPNNGYPASVAFYQDRLCWASTKAEPLGIWMSAIGDYYNYAVEIDQEDDAPISVNLVSQSLNSVSSLLSKNDLIGFTADGSWKICSRSQAQGLTAKTVFASQQSFEGASNLRPLVINDRALYVLNQGATVRDLAYDYSSDSYIGDDLTLLSRHLFRGHAIQSWCYAQEPDSLVYAVRDDGVLLTLTYNKEQEIYAWAKHDTQGEFVAVQSLRGDTQTLVYFIVKRFNKLYVETLSARTNENTVTMNFMDCSAVYNGEAVNQISGLDYLEGATVQILADGSEQPEQVVTGGKITLDTSASYVRVGLGYTKKITTMNLDYPRQNGTIQGRKKGTSVIKLLLDKSYGGEVLVEDVSKRPTHIKNTLPKNYGEPLELFSGMCTATVRGGKDINLYVTAYQDSPVPFNVLSIMVDIIAEE